MELVIVHITDIHVRQYDDLDILLTRTESIGGAICHHITEPENAAVLFCVTGDFAFSGTEEQYDIVGTVLEEIFMVITKRFEKVHIYPVFVPGNHDCNFNAEGAAVRSAVLESSKLDITNREQIKCCTRIQKEFFDFAKKWKDKYDALSCDEDKILTQNIVRFDKENITLNFHCINTSWCSKKLEEKGKMKLGLIDQVELQQSNNDIVITMMHHDAEWLDWDDIEEWKKYYKKYSDIILVGHDHSAEYVRKTNYDDSTNGYIKGNQLYDTSKPEQSGFNILKIKTEQMLECFFSYEWNGNVYKNIMNTSYSPFIRNKFVGSGIELKESVQKFLEELDIDIYNKNKRELKLSDIFGFPTLKEEKGKATKFFRNEQSLIDYIDEQKFVSIRGQKEYGKTALLKQLFKIYFNKKQFPLFLNISSIKTADGEELNKIISRGYSETYNNIDSDTIMQKAADERICFIDNFEEMVMSDKIAKKFLVYLTNKFGRVIVARNHKLDLINPLSYIETNDYIKENFKILMIQSVKGSYQERIINKWLSLESEEELDSLAFDVRRKEIYTKISVVMKGNLFNRTPTDLLLVLSYLEQEPTQLNYSRYSYIYDSLILRKLNAISNNDTNISSIYKTILQSLAYKMFEDNKQGFVAESYITGVIYDYKESYSNLKLKASDVIQRLVKYRFLECSDSNYRFRYSYMFYYFTGNFIDRKLPPDKRCEVIKKVFENIDNDINYNIALFLAYSINIEYEILPLAQKMVSTLLDGVSEFKYEEIKDLIEEWGGDIEKRVERIYTVPKNEDIPALREKALEEKDDDRDDQQGDQESDNLQTEEDVKRVNQDVVKISRLVDFMGNLLKNYSGEMENATREETINLMFVSATKVIGSFCSFSQYMVDKLITLLEEKIKGGNENEIQAKSEFIEAIKFLLAAIWQQFVGDNVTGLACSLESEIIKENIDSYCSANNTDFTNMVRLEYLIRIASAKLPVTEIREKFNGKNCLEDISQKIMKDNIYGYLSSYQFDPKDRQAVCDILGFKIKDVLLEKQKQIEERRK